MSEISDRFGRDLRRLRAQRGWSQEQLAGVAEINRSFLGEIERGESVPSLDTLAKLADALDITLAELLSGLADLRQPLSPGDVASGKSRRLTPIAG